MRITITIDATEAEAAALVDKLAEVFGDNVQVETEESAGAATVAGTTTPPVETVTPAAPPTTSAPGRGQIFKNANLVGDHVIYGEWQIGVPDWLLNDHVGVARPGGETQAVRCEPKRPDNSFEGYDRYLQDEFENTALEMGGAWRVFNWEMQQGDVAVRDGFTYDLTAVFHPLVKTKVDDREEFMSIDLAADWMTGLEWRWVVKDQGGAVIAADEWQDGETMGTLTYDLPFEQPVRYSWSWTADYSGAAIFSIEFRNKWALAMTKVWLHGAICVER